MKQPTPSVSAPSSSLVQDVVRRGADEVPAAYSLAELVAARRAELGLSLRALGERSGIHYSHLSKVEHGADSAGIGALAGLSLGLDLPLTELLRASGIEANLGLPSFAGYLQLAWPEVTEPVQGELSAQFERMTGLSADLAPRGPSRAGDPS